MQRKVSSLEERVKKIYDYQINPEEVEKSLPFLRISLVVTISGCVGFQNKMMRAKKIAKSKRDFYGQIRARHRYYF